MLYFAQCYILISQSLITCFDGFKHNKKAISITDSLSILLTQHIYLKICFTLSFLILAFPVYPFVDFLLLLVRYLLTLSICLSQPLLFVSYYRHSPKDMIRFSLNCFCFFLNKPSQPFYCLLFMLCFPSF